MQIYGSTLDLLNQNFGEVLGMYILNRYHDNFEI